MSWIDTHANDAAASLGLAPVIRNLGRVRDMEPADIEGLRGTDAVDTLVAIRAGVTGKSGAAGAWCYLLDRRIGELDGATGAGHHNFAPRAEFRGTFAPSLMTVLRKHSPEDGATDA